MSASLATDRITLRPAHAQELSALTELALRSKAVHGYNDAFMAACRDELTLAEHMLGTGLIVADDADGVPIGLARVVCSGYESELWALFVEPRSIGQGVGKVLFRWAADYARAQGAELLGIDADPGVVSFYEAMGARQAGKVPSGSIPGRMLPHLIVNLADWQASS